MPHAAAPQRRTLRFDSVDDAIGEAERLAEAEREGRLARAGNWSLGKALGHLATWANFAHDGYPPEVHPPLPIRLVIRLMRGRILRDGMTPGMKVGRMPGGTLGLEELTTQEGLERYRTALRRLAASAPTGASPVFGKLTHEQWIQLNLRHAELHLGFQVPTEAADAKA
jgi:hypothetical protein